MRVKWSQNFLKDGNIARKCVESLRPEAADAVLEIGPGRGALTGILLGAVGRLVAAEIDPALCGALRARFGGLPNFSLLEGDFLNLDLDQEPALQGGAFKVIGNLPYAVTSPILQKVLAWRRWPLALFMVQKEVGERLMAGPGSKAYGVLTVSVQARCRVEKAFAVPRTCFRPAPQVDSMVVALSPLEHPAFSAENEAAFFQTVRGAFAHRRKTLVNSLELATGLPEERLRAAIQASGLNPGTRAETLSVADFQRLAGKLYNHE